MFDTTQLNVILIYRTRIKHFCGTSPVASHLYPETNDCADFEFMSFKTINSLPECQHPSVTFSLWAKNNVHFKESISISYHLPNLKYNHSLNEWSMWTGHIYHFITVVFCWNMGTKVTTNVRSQINTQKNSHTDNTSKIIPWESLTKDRVLLLLSLLSNNNFHKNRKYFVILENTSLSFEFFTIRHFCQIIWQI